MFETVLRRAVIGAASLAFIAGCSGSGSVGPSQSSVVPSSPSAAGTRFLRGAAVERPLFVPTVPHPWNLPHAWPAKKKQKEVLFVADPQDNQILMYNPKTPNPSPEGSITDGIDYAFGVAIDKKGNLYVANLLGGSAGSITVYPKGSSSPSLTITNGADGPYGIAVDSKGEIFASNLDNDTVTAYKAGATTPFETIDFSALGQGLGVGVDGKDNIWVGCDTDNRVYEIPAGSSTPVNANLSGLSGTINVAFGKKDVMYVSNFAGANVTVYTYGTTVPTKTITDGTPDPTFSGFTSLGYYFQSNQDGNVVGYKKGQTSPFSTITGIPDPRGIASTPLVKK